MNIKNIKNFAVSYISKAGNFLKTTVKLPYAKLYFFISLLLMLLFTIINFPYDVLLRNRLQKLDKSIVKNIYIGSIETSLVDVTSVSSIHAVLKNNDEINLKDIIINPTIDPYTLFIDKVIKSDFQINGIKYSSKNSEVSFIISGNIDLKRGDKTFIDSGIVKFMIQNAIVKIEEIKIPTQAGTFPISLPDIKISSINFNASLKNRELKIRKCKISGNDIRGAITGSIKIAGIFNNSVLNLKVSIDSESAVLKDYKELLSSYSDAKGRISFPVKGTIARPKIDFKRKSTKSP